MDRRDFLKITGVGLGGLALPAFYGRAIAAEELLSTIDVATKKRLADVALNAAKADGALEKISEKWLGAPLPKDL